MLFLKFLCKFYPSYRIPLNPLPNERSFKSSIVGEKATARSAEFASALVFAQEYGIMAVSVQDRPFLPKGKVVFSNGLPAECISAFRKWVGKTNNHDNNDAAAAATATTSQVIPLHAAIEAIR